MTAPRPLQIEQGASLERTLRLRDKATGQPLDLTGWAALLQVRAAPGAENPVLLEMSSGTGGGIEIDAPAGQVRLFLSGTQTAAVEPWPGEAVYELVISHAATGRAWRLRRGPATVSVGVALP